jgi:hypothetical protein
MTKKKAIPVSEWKWFGDAGHFICAQWCQFHLCTLIGDALVSTVGKYFPDDNVREILSKSRGVILQGMGDERRYDYMKKIGYEDIGYERKYETMVFKVSGKICSAKDCDCGMPEIIPSETGFDGYNTARDAANGHMEMCRKVASGEKLK